MAVTWPVSSTLAPSMSISVPEMSPAVASMAIVLPATTPPPRSTSAASISIVVEASRAATETRPLALMSIPPPVVVRFVSEVTSPLVAAILELPAVIVPGPVPFSMETPVPCATKSPAAVISAFSIRMASLPLLAASAAPSVKSPPPRITTSPDWSPMLVASTTPSMFMKAPPPALAAETMTLAPVRLPVLVTGTVSLPGTGSFVTGVSMMKSVTRSSSKAV